MTSPFRAVTDLSSERDTACDVNSTWLATRHEPAIRFVGAVYECFGDELQTVRFGCTFKLRVRLADERRPIRRLGRHARNYCRKFCIANRVVVQRAVRLHVPEPGAQGRGDSGQCGYLLAK